MTALRHARRNLPLIAGFAALVLLYGAGAARYDGFLSLAAVVNLLRDNAFLGVVAVGVTFVIISGGIDLSVGAVLGLTSVLVGVLVMRHGWPVWAAIPAALAFGTAFGAAMGIIIHATGLRPFIVTLAGMFFARGLGFLIHLESIGISDPGHAALQRVAIPIGDAHLPLEGIVLLAAVAAAWWVLAMTPFGRNVYAVGGHEESARLMGVPIAGTKIGVYAVSGLCAALGGVLLTLYLGSGNHSDGVGLELDAIAAVVIGGTLLAGGAGSVLGTLAGVLIIGIIQSTIAYENYSSGLTRVFIGAALLVFVLLQRALTRGAA